MLVQAAPCTKSVGFVLRTGPPAGEPPVTKHPDGHSSGATAAAGINRPRPPVLPPPVGPVSARGVPQDVEDLASDRGLVLLEVRPGQQFRPVREAGEHRGVQVAAGQLRG